MEEGQNVQTFNSHLGYGSWLLPVESRKVIEIAVEKASLIAHRGSIVFNAYLFKCQDIENENPKNWRKIITNCFLIPKTVYMKDGNLDNRSVAKKNPLIFDIYKDIYGENNFIDGTGLNDVVATMAKNYADIAFWNFAGPESTAYTNHMINAVRSLFTLPSKWIAEKMYYDAYRILV